MFVPSTWKLNLMITAAEAKFEAARVREQAAREARWEKRYIRAQTRAVRGRLYAFIQGVDPR